MYVLAYWVRTLVCIKIRCGRFVIARGWVFDWEGSGLPPSWLGIHILDFKSRLGAP